MHGYSACSVAQESSACPPGLTSPHSRVVDAENKRFPLPPPPSPHPPLADFTQERCRDSDSRLSPTDLGCTCVDLLASNPSFSHFLTSGELSTAISSKFGPLEYSRETTGHKHHGETNLHPRGARMAQDYLVQDKVHEVPLSVLVGRHVDLGNQRYEFVHLIAMRLRLPKMTS